MMDPLMIETPQLRVTRSAEQAKLWFSEQGLAISDWAMCHGFNPALVFAVLHGRRKCLRGQSHLIAVALGLKALPEANSRAATKLLGSADVQSSTEEPSMSL